MSGAEDLAIVLVLVWLVGLVVRRVFSPPRRTEYVALDSAQVVKTFREKP